jgi:hypothetical protein
MPKVLLENIMRDIVLLSYLKNGLREDDNTAIGEWNGNRYKVNVFIQKL